MIINIKNLFKLLLFSIVLIIFGCSYSFYSRSNPHLKTVMISEFENESEQYELPQKVETYLIEKIESDNQLKMMAGEADMKISGIILSYDKQVLAYDKSENPLEWQTTIRFSVEVKDLVKSKTIWTNKNLSLSAVYREDETDEESDLENSSEEDAWKSIIFDLGEIILANSVEQW
ncbi:MAG: LptE family protein [Candidatus Cloacimonetes bacterium]|nr:LptE family protein [Candidatus Cloacimonadota bacterium]